MGTLLRLLGLVLLIAGGVVVFLGARRLPDSLPSGTAAEIVHIADFSVDPPRSPYLHVVGGWYLPYASLAVSEGEADSAPSFFLIPLAATGNSLLADMQREAEATYDGDVDAAAGWDEYVASRLDLSGVPMLVLSTDAPRWTEERAVAVETRYVEGVVRTADAALAPELLAMLDQQFDGIAPQRMRILYEGEIPPAEESLRLAMLLGGLAGVLGLAMMVASLFTRRPRWLR